MDTVTIIKKKRAGKTLSPKELSFMVDGYTSGEIPDYQMSAFLMAIFFQGMIPAETAQLVTLMQYSGSLVDLSKIKAPKVDKHSTGGIGDKTTLLLGPILASCGFYYPTIAGRSLGHTGGTVDKLESIPGFRCGQTLKRFQELVGSVGLAFLGQTEKICPADRKLYALRDVTGTVESLPLIVASIMSKKLAEGADCLLFDVKCGSGAFMKTLPEAVSLAQALVDVGKASGKEVRALVTDMSQPLGRAVGNAIEVNECVAYLRRGPQDAAPDPLLHELTMELGVELFQLGLKKRGERPKKPQEIRKQLEQVLQSGQAYAKFLEIVSLQGGDTEAMDKGLPLAKKRIQFLAPEKGFISSMDGETIGLALNEMGGGRKKASDKVDPSVGFFFQKTLGDAVRKGELVAQIYAKDSKTGALALKMLQSAVIVGEKTSKPKLIQKRI